MKPWSSSKVGFGLIGSSDYDGCDRDGSAELVTSLSVRVTVRGQSGPVADICVVVARTIGKTAPITCDANIAESARRCLDCDSTSARINRRMDFVARVAGRRPFTTQPFRKSEASSIVSRLIATGKSSRVSGRSARRGSSRLDARTQG